MFVLCVKDNILYLTIDIYKNRYNIYSYCYLSDAEEAKIIPCLFYDGIKEYFNSAEVRAALNIDH